MGGIQKLPKKLFNSPHNKPGISFIMLTFLSRVMPSVRKPDYSPAHMCSNRAHTVPAASDWTLAVGLQL